MKVKESESNKTKKKDEKREEIDKGRKRRKRKEEKGMDEKQGRKGGLRWIGASFFFLLLT